MIESFFLSEKKVVLHQKELGQEKIIDNGNQQVFPNNTLALVNKSVKIFLVLKSEVANSIYLVVPVIKVYGET